MANFFDDFDLDVQKTSGGYVGIEPFNTLNCVTHRHCSLGCSEWTTPEGNWTCISCGSCAASCVEGCWSMHFCTR